MIHFFIYKSSIWIIPIWMLGKFTQLKCTYRKISQSFIFFSTWRRAIAIHHKFLHNSLIHIVCNDRKKNKTNYLFLLFFQAIRSEFAIPSSLADAASGNGKKSDDLINSTLLNNKPTAAAAEESLADSVAAATETAAAATVTAYAAGSQETDR